MTPSEICDQLGRVRTLAFVARSANPGGWNGQGNGTVVVAMASDGAVTFTESGFWRPEGGHDVRFHNVFRWSSAADRLRLEHLRFGVEHPVYLFDLQPVSDGEWCSTSPHLCHEDCYSASLLLDDNRIVMRWSIAGPRKEEEIEYVYSWP